MVQHSLTMYPHKTKVASEYATVGRVVENITGVRPSLPRALTPIRHAQPLDGFICWDGKGSKELQRHLTETDTEMRGTYCMLLIHAQPTETEYIQ